MNENRISETLTQYDGSQESLNQTVAVLAEELGENWTSTVFEELGGLPVELKEKLNHAFNYYSALIAWQEAQTYLEQSEPLSEEVQERLPVLKHWLDFFGDPGIALYQQLEQKVSEKNVVSDETPEIKEEISQPQNETPEVQPSENLSDVSKEKKVTEVKEEKPTYDPESPEVFTIQKAKKEIELLDNVQAWLSARCLQLNNMEVFAYPYYGFAVDLMRQTVKDIQAVLDLQDKTALSDLYEGGEEAISRKKQAVEADIETAVQNCESATTALIDEKINMDDVRKTLGDLDENSEPEYLGPAPDGFELLDDSNAPLDEKAVKEQYQRLEKEVLAEDKDINPEKNTSQKPKNSVQRKLTFSLKPKK